MAKTLRVLRYTGTSHERVISKEDWARVGVEHETLKWTRDAPGNDIPLSRVTLNDEDFATYITADSDFVVTDVEIEERPEEESGEES